MFKSNGRNTEIEKERERGREIKQDKAKDSIESQIEKCGHTICLPDFYRPTFSTGDEQSSSHYWMPLPASYFMGFFFFFL